jgi:hypothetical protein
MILNGRVRCTARVSGPLAAGQKTGLTFALRNIGHRTVKATLSNGTFAFVLRAAGGVSYDSRVPLEGASGPPPFPTPIPAAATKTFRPADVWVRWSGPVSIQPVCSGVALPVLHTNVVAPGPGPAPTKQRAIADVVAAAGHLFDKCRPVSSGTPVIGEIDPPSGHAPPMHAVCSIELQREGQFWVARTLVLVPADLRGVQVRQPYETVVIPIRHQTAEAIAWEFVDTANGAVPVAANTADTTMPSSAMAPDWDWTGSHWEGPGGSRCGGELTTGGGSPNATIEFVSVCPS